ncbi:hypothetical protein B0H66DRAFT_604176 [Apodospora peruviana]|uniref:Uncharacterized protein n=1 Tax=Apodospora peruviana TaxID=516989 RepID=A0AAE0I0I4_9PEZI|nr:hypothetical protein B0H66DRAFT_604176 [Apodospora peruviana]
MKRDTQIARHLAFALAAISSALALPQPQDSSSAGGVAPAPVIPWVSVDTSGFPHTVTPVVSVDGNGALTTLDNPPDSLTATATYTLSPNGHASTYTGLPPVATPTGDNGAGTFLACDRGQGDDEPFCEPERGAILHPGQTYYVTWNPQWFQPIDTIVLLQTKYVDQSGDGTISLVGIPASHGFFTWSIPSDMLETEGGVSALNVSLALAYQVESEEGTSNWETQVGPTVIITEKGIGPDPNDGRTHVVAIVVPVVIVLVLVALGGFCFWSWRRHGSLPIVGKMMNRRGGGGAGYGIRQSQAQRVPGGGGLAGGYMGGGMGTDKPAPGVGIQLTDRNSWSPTSGRNVFREEIRRQQTGER